MLNEIIRVESYKIGGLIRGSSLWYFVIAA